MSRYTRNISSRLGRYERPRFGGSGFGEGAYSQFDWRSTSPEDETASWHPEFNMEEAAAQEERRAEAGLPPMISSGDDSGTDWGAIGGAITSIFGMLAPVGIGVWQSEQAKDAAEKARKREEARLGEMARQRALMTGYGPPPPAKGSGKVGLFIGLGVTALVAIVSVIVIVKRTGK